MGHIVSQTNWFHLRYRKARYFISHHTRVVTSGSFPLYRLMCLGSVIAGSAQIIKRTVPASTQVASGGNFSIEIMFSLLTLLGGLLALAGLYVEPEKSDEEPSDKLHLSLSLELAGIMMMAASLISYICGVLGDSGFPVAQVTWCGIMFLVYIVFKRLREIRRAIRKLRK